MRFLKKKIALVNAAKGQEPLHFCSALKSEANAKIQTQVKLEDTTQAKVESTRIKIDNYQDRTELSISGSESSPISNKKSNLYSSNQAKIKSPKETLRASRSTKNIVKNYAQAIFKFVLSSMATNYLSKFIKNEGVSLINFHNYVRSVKSQIESLHNFRTVLLVTEADSQEVASYKRIIAQMGKIFIKFFSVNWIYHSKMKHKEIHLKYRHRMLRRIENPELFTYLKT